MIDQASKNENKSCFIDTVKRKYVSAGRFENIVALSNREILICFIRYFILDRGIWLKGR